MRKGEGQWQAFPFWYTVLALSDMDVPEASKELGYAARVLERTARRAAAATIHATRRRQLAYRALERV